MRFDYVAAGVVVLGAAVSDARSVPSSPQRTPKFAKHHSRHAGLRAIQPLSFNNPTMMQASKALPSNIQLTNGISDDESATQNGVPQLANMADPNEIKFPSRLAGDMLSASPIVASSTSPPGVAEELEIIKINPTGAPEYVVMQAPINQGEMLRSDIPSAPRRYLPSPPLYVVENAGKALPEPASQAFESVYSSLPLQIQKAPQKFPMPSVNPTDTLLEELKKITNEQSTPSIPVTAPNGPPPPPLLRAVLADAVGSTNTTNNSSTMGDSERATVTTPTNVTLSSPANVTGSTTDNSASESGMRDSERATLATPAVANDTLLSALTNNITNSNPSNGTDSSQGIPLNSTNATAAASPPSVPRSPLDEE